LMACRNSLSNPKVFSYSAGFSLTGWSP
jgi:hypothetical protein